MVDFGIGAGVVVFDVGTGVVGLEVGMHVVPWMLLGAAMYLPEVAANC